MEHSLSFDVVILSIKYKCFPTLHCEEYRKRAVKLRKMCYWAKPGSYCSND